MKLLGNLLLTVCLVTGCLSAATAYMTRTASPDAAGLFLGDDAGATPLSTEARAELDAQLAAGDLSAEDYVAATESSTAIVEKHDEEPVTAEQVESLRAADVRYLHTKAFSLARWPYAWIFGLSAAGLLAGSLLVRAGAKADIRRAAPEEGSEEHAAASPTATIAAITAELNALRADLPALASDRDRLRAIMARLGAIQADAVPNFIDARPRLIARLGLGGYAEVMDRFAAMERKINRAWSAAADAHLPESTTALDDAAALAPEVAAKLA